MNRKELYYEITSLKLQDEVKNRFGKNYTQCTNTQLNSVVTGAKAGLSKINPPTCRKDNSPFSRLINILYRKKLLLKSEVDYINS